MSGASWRLIWLEMLLWSLRGITVFFPFLNTNRMTKWRDLSLPIQILLTFTSPSISNYSLAISVLKMAWNFSDMIKIKLWFFLILNLTKILILLFSGFTTYEVGRVSSNKLVLVLKDIGRISFSRDLPVEDVRFFFENNAQKKSATMKGCWSIIIYETFKMLFILLNTLILVD